MAAAPNVRTKAQSIRAYAARLQQGNPDLISQFRAVTDIADAFSTVQDGLDLLLKQVGDASASTSSTTIINNITGGSTPPNPDPVTIGTPTWKYRLTPDAYGNLLLDATIPYTPPAGWLGMGVHVYYEWPDHSANSTALTLGGGAGLGSDALQGDWLPIDGGIFPLDPSALTPSAKIFGLVQPAVAQDLRVYLVGYDNLVDPPPVRFGATGASPSVVFTIQPPAAAQKAGQENAPVLTHFAATAGASIDRGDGKQVTPITVTFDPPTDPRIASVLIEAVWDSPSIPVEKFTINSGDLAKGTYTFRVDSTQALHDIAIYALSIDGSGNVNTIVPGYTPTATVSVGSVAGTLALNNAILSSVAAYFQVQSGQFGLASAGITTDLIANLAVTSSQLAAAAVITSKLASGAVQTSNISPGNITNPLIASGAVGTGNITSNAITSGLIASGAVQTTHIANLAVTNALIANGAVGTANIQAAAITTALIANAAITNALIANAAITDAKIGDVSANKITAGTISAVTISSLVCNGGAISGTTLSLFANGTTTSVNNLNDTIFGTGLSVGLSVSGTDIHGNNPSYSMVLPGMLISKDLFLSQTPTGLTSASGGSATLPSNPKGFFIIKGDFGTQYKVPCYGL